MVQVNLPGPSRRGRASMIPVPGGYTPYIAPKEPLLGHGLLGLTEEMSEQVISIPRLYVLRNLINKQIRLLL